MDIEILKQFNSKKYKSLTDTEKIALITKAIRNIQQEQGMKELEINFGEDGFGYDYENKKINLDKSQIENGYIMLAGIIHELRHQWQREVDNQPEDIGGGISYILAPQEKDAHEYVIRELMKFQKTLNDDEFDIYILTLMMEYIGKRNNASNTFKNLGYENIKEIASESNRYLFQSLVFNAEEAERMNTSDFMYQKEKGIYLFFNINEERNNCSFNYINDKDISNRLGGFKINIINNNIYINNMFFERPFTTEEFISFFNEAMQAINSFLKENDCQININSISFPPAVPGVGGSLGLKKEEYDNFKKSLNYHGQPYTLEDLNSSNVDKSHISNPNPGDFYSYSKTQFGSNYESIYTKEQFDVIRAALDYKEIKSDEEYSEEPKSPGFVALFQFNHKYSARKMALILAAQKKGLNTFYYLSLNEEQIEQLMIMQLEGFKREDWIPYLKKDADLSQARKILEKKKPDIKPIDGFELDDDYNIIIKERTLPTDTEGPIPEE